MYNGENTLIYTRIGNIGEENINCAVLQMAGLTASVGIELLPKSWAAGTV